MDLDTGKAIGMDTPVGSESVSNTDAPAVKAQSSVADGVKLGCGMFIVLPILLILGAVIFVMCVGSLPNP